MQLNTDISQRVVVNTPELSWVPSPIAGVERRMLARDGQDQPCATSIVRYAPGSTFTQHSHPLGEEIIVLDGVFADEHGDYPAGTYIKNPPGSAHSPRSPVGCTLFVKLQQMDAADTRRVVVRPADQRWSPGMVAGLSVIPLDQFGTTHTALVRWAPGTYFNKHQHFGGEEIFVLDGTFQDEYASYPTGSWLRSPHLSVHQPYSETGCLIFVKVGHLQPH